MVHKKQWNKVERNDPNMSFINRFPLTPLIGYEGISKWREVKSCSHMSNDYITHVFCLVFWLLLLYDLGAALS